MPVIRITARLRSDKCLLSLNQLRKFSHSIARRTANFRRASQPVRVSFAMQLAYFSYPRDFDGTARQAAVDWWGATRIFVLPSEKPGAPTELRPSNSRNPAGAPPARRPRQVRSRPAIRSHVAIPSRRETNRFLSFLRGGPPRLGLLLSVAPRSLFIALPHISTLSPLFLPIGPRKPAAPARPVDSAKFFCGLPVRSRRDFVPRFGAPRIKIKEDRRVWKYTVRK